MRRATDLHLSPFQHHNTKYASKCDRLRHRKMGVTVTSGLILASFLLFSSFLGCSAKPQDDDEEEEEIPKTCEQYILGFVFGLMNATNKCLAGQSTFKMKGILDLVHRVGCLLKCSLQEQGVIGMDGVFDDIGAAFYFEDTFPQQVKDLALPEAQACFALASNFNPKEYWCGTYLPFIECNFKAILKGLIPYGGDCISNPIIGILFGVLKNITPLSPALSESMDELRRSQIKMKDSKTCFDKNCTRLYEYKKVNGSQTVVIYDRDLNVVSVQNKTISKPTSKQSKSNYYGR